MSEAESSVLAQLSLSSNDDKEKSKAMKMEMINDDSMDQQVTPWDVQGAVVAGQVQAIDYDKLIKQFGVQPITPELIERFEKVTKHRAHTFIRRGIFFAHRDLTRILDLHEQGKPFYLYTGRGPSNESVHLGHTIPFIFCKYLQDVFHVNLVIQLTDDEKFMFKEHLTLAECQKYAVENAKDIIAFGFDPEKTFIFMDSQYYGYMFECILHVQKAINVNQCSTVFGFTPASSVGQLSYPCAEIATAFPGAFPHLFGSKRDIPSFIPCAVDQDPYFRLARDIAPRLKYEKPSCIYSIFFPALQGFQSKMSSSIDSSAIFLSDSPKTIKDKINKFAFSGGQSDIDSHRKLGGNPDIDVSFQYLKFFFHDDTALTDLENRYRSGALLTGELKAKCIEVLQDFVVKFQLARSQVDQSVLKAFMDLPMSPRERALSERLAALEAAPSQK
jgi:tryptophanyl-tRNA synthetase